MDKTVFDLIKWGESELRRSNIEQARQEAETLFAHSVNARRKDLCLMSDSSLPAHKVKLFKHCIKLRKTRYPLQYILNSAEFMGLTLELEKGVFIPRPETELLVEAVLNKVKLLNKKRVNIIEIGTGCGNIAISLTKNLTCCRLIASDISEEALKVAAKNARSHGVNKRIKFVRSDFFDKISAVYNNLFDIIISNPPYVRRAEIDDLQPEIAHEDIKAIDGGKDGLYPYRRILKDGIRCLKKGGVFAFEIGWDQARDIAQLIKKEGRFTETNFFRDYAGRDRIVITKRIS